MSRTKGNAQAYDDRVKAFEKGTQKQVAPSGTPPKAPTGKGSASGGSTNLSTNITLKVNEQVLAKTVEQVTIRNGKLKSA